MDKVHDEESDGYDMPYHGGDTLISGQSFRAASQSSFAMSSSKSTRKPKIGLSRSKTLSKIKEREVSCENFADPKCSSARRKTYPWPTSDFLWGAAQFHQKQDSSPFHEYELKSEFPDGARKSISLFEILMFFFVN
uniref:Uncharacterized protein n=1 Tax=Ditylenchus dipsaci TaxID=166011 RepID=A0A915D0G4_9BILA